MDAKELYTLLSASYANCYFIDAEQFEQKINEVSYPCVLVVPIITKQVDTKTDRFNLHETVGVWSLDKSDFQVQFEDAYDAVRSLEDGLLETIYPIIDKIEAIENISELYKFSDNVMAGAFALKIKITGNCYG